MRLIWKIGFAIVGISALAIGVINTNKEGGAIDVLRYEVAVLRDEVPELAQQWAGSSSTLTAAAYVPASLAVAAGIRAGNADYDKSGPSRFALTYGIPISLRSEIMRNDNFAAAKRARNRILRAMTQIETKEHFNNLFSSWWSNRTACIEAIGELELIRELSPSIATLIDRKNEEFGKLARREEVGTLTVAERTTYLKDRMRVPHLVRTRSNWTKSNLYVWTEVDPTEFSHHRSDGLMVRACPKEDHSHGGQIQVCFGYVNFRLSALERKIYDNLKRENATIEFVMQMMQDMIQDEFHQNSLREQAEQNVKSMPASEVPVADIDLRVKAEYERLRCQ